MLSVEIDDKCAIAILAPDGALSKSDFESAAEIIDPYIEATGKLRGLVIHTKSFPGWDSFAALASHLNFVKEHHKKIFRVAISTDSTIANVAEVIAGHFVNAKLKTFSYDELDAARNWAAGDPASA